MDTLRDSQTDEFGPYYQTQIESHSSRTRKNRAGRRTSHESVAQGKATVTQKGRRQTAAEPQLHETVAGLALVRAMTAAKHSRAPPFGGHAMYLRVPALIGYMLEHAHGASPRP
jgi:hypothetical protein